MACCLCVDDSPVEGSKYGQYYGNPNQFQVGMNKSCCANPLWATLGCVCGPCSQCHIRHKLIDGDIQNYICCQGYFGGCGCCMPGEMGEESCPALCLCLESFCCLSCAVSANRMLIMDKYRLVPDPWDNKIIRCNNLIQVLSCACHCLALINRNFRELSRILDLVAEMVFYSTVGCMTAQMATELHYQESIAPVAEAMDRSDLEPSMEKTLL